MYPISVVDAFGRAWDGMVARLFKPFSIGKWFALGFSAWLAGLMDGGGGSFPGGGGGEKGEYDAINLRIAEMWEQYREWIIVGGIVLAVLVVALSVLFLWLCARGKFMFLRNTIDNTAKVSEPWHAFKVPATSFFWWQIGFGILTLVILVVLVGAGFLLLWPALQHKSWTPASVSMAAVLIFLFTAVMLIVLTIQLFMTDFIVPLMMKHHMLATEAWAFFLPLLKHHIPQFTLYVLFLMIMYFVTMIAIIAGCILTCCCLMVLIIIPYINAVVTLPISVLFRLLSIEYLRSYGPDYDLFTEAVVDQPVSDTGNGDSIPSPS